MNFQQLLQQMQLNNITMSAKDGKLKVFDPDKNLNPTLLAGLKAHKPKLIEFISEGRGFTQSDFKYASLSTEQISDLQRRYPMLQNLYATTPMQRGMLFHGLVDGSGASYTTQFSGDLSGELNVEAFRQAWQTIIDRHDVYRTCFVGFEHAMVHQLIQTQATVPFTVQDWRDLPAEQQQQKLAAFRTADKQQGFDFAVAPLMRVALIRLAQNRYHLVWSQHHALTDGWCGPLIFAELNASYLAACKNQQPQLAPLPPYENYIAWLHNQDINRARHFWQDHLSPFNAPTPLAIDRLPNENLRPGEHGDTTAKTGLVKLHLTFDEQVTKGLDNFAKRNECTVNVLLQAAWAYLLHRYSGENAVLFGATVSGRPADLPGMEHMVGLFINTVPVGVNLSQGTRLKALLDNLQQQNAERDQFSFMSLTEIQELSRIPNGQPLFDSLVVFENFPSESAFTPDNSPQGDQQMELVMDNVAVDEHTNYAITLGAFMQQQLLIKIGYRLEQFSTKAMERLFQHLKNLLTTMSGLTDCDIALDSLPYLSEAEKNQLTLTGKTIPLQANDNLVARFEAQVNVNGQATALVFENQRLSFDALNRQANQVAHYLHQQGLAQSQPLVAVCLPRSAEMVIAILGILKAGAAYVPLEVDLPASRKAFILKDANITLELDFNPQQSAAIAQCADHNLGNLTITGEQLAYVIYTSGSTGMPKGVMVEHANACHFIEVFKTQLQQLQVTEDAPWLWHASYAFDASVKGLLALTLGKKVVLANNQQSREPRALVQLMAAEQVAVFNGVPQLAQLVLEQYQSSEPLALIVGGEALPQAIANTIIEHCQRTHSKAINAYGPTELTINASYSMIEADHPINIGQPVPNASAWVLAEDLSQLNIGAIGELYVAGSGVVRGYLNQPQLTAERFIENPHQPGQRLYRSGDKVALMQDVQGHSYLDFIGRVDHQVKIRGYRIELGEIEAALLQQQAVSECRVLVKTSDNGTKSLQAFVVASHNDAEQCLAALKQTLPEPMIPAQIIMLDTLPKTPGGKIDSHELQQFKTQNQSVNYAPPRTPTEQKLCRLWQQVLGKDNIGLDDNFFELGGTSIMSMQVMALSMQQGMMVNPGQLFSHRTVRALAALLSPDEVAPDEVATDEDQTLLLMNNATSDLTLFCMPPFGGLATSYGNLAQALEKVAKVYGFQAPELFSDITPYSIQDLARLYIDYMRKTQPQGPYYIAGWSTGAVIAYEVALQLQQAELEVGYLALFDALPSEPNIKQQQLQLGGKPTWFSSIKSIYQADFKLDWDALALLDEQQGWAVLEQAFEQQKLAPAEFDAQLVSRYLRQLSHFSQAIFDHQCAPSHLPLDLYKVAKATVTPGTPALEFNGYYNWDKVSKGQITVINAQGTHRTMLQVPYLDSLAQNLMRRLKSHTGATTHKPKQEA